MERNDKKPNLITWDDLRVIQGATFGIASTFAIQAAFDQDVIVAVVETACAAVTVGLEVNSAHQADKAAKLEIPEDTSA